MGRITTVDVNGVKLTCRVKLDEDATSVSSLFLLHKYTDDQIVSFLIQRPGILYLDYMTKKMIVDGIRHGWIFVTMIDDVMFLSKIDNDDHERMILYMPTCSSRIAKDMIVQNYRRFCKLLLMARTSK